jgi:DNA-binding transcriptional ArsR family regulator
MNIPRDTAEVWSSWFRALSDPTRVLMLHLLASEKRPLTIGEMVEALDVGQSTVSHHCRILEDVGFVICEREGTSTRCRINNQCLDMFPSAADVIMGHAPTDDDLTGCAPWVGSASEPRHLRRPARRGALAGRGRR